MYATTVIQCGRLRFRWAITAAFGWLCCVTTWADAPLSASQPVRPVSREASHGPVRVTLELDRDEVNAPDTLILSLRIRAEKGVEAAWPEIGGTLGDFLVSATEDKPLTEDDLTRTQVRVYTLAPIYDGRGEIPALRVAYTDTREKMDGSTDTVSGEVVTAPVAVTVHVRLADVKDPLSLPTGWPLRLLYWFVGLVVAAILIALAARRWRARRRRAEAVAARPVPAHEWALAELDMLDALGLIERGRVQEYYYRINAILRGYVERRWGLMAAEQTSEEFLRDLQRSVVLGDEHKAVLRRFIDACDPVKYARQQPSGDEIRWVGHTARDFVRTTIPSMASDVLEKAA